MLGTVLIRRRAMEESLCAVRAAVAAGAGRFEAEGAGVIFGASYLPYSGAIGVSGVLRSVDGEAFYLNGPTAFGTNSVLRTMPDKGGVGLMVGLNGTIRRTVDGINWTSPVSGVGTTLRGVDYNGSLYVAVGTGNVIRTSPDGITWTARVVPAVPGGMNVNSVVCAPDGRCVAGGQANGGSVNGHILTSVDGITWVISHTLAGGTAFADGVYDPVTDAFVLTGSGSGTLSAIWRSTDGVVFSEVYTTGSSGLTYMSQGNGMMVTGHVGDTIISVDGGATWSSAPVLLPDPYRRIIKFLDGLWYMGGPSDGFKYYTTTDFTTYSFFGGYAGAGVPNITDAAYSAAAGKYVTVNEAVVATSDTGFSEWVITTAGAGFRACCGGPSGFYVAGAGGAIKYSADGITWVSRVSGTGTLIRAIATRADGFVMASGASSLLITSPDGITWTTQNTGVGGAFYERLAYIEGVWFALNGNTTARSVDDGVNWTHHSLPASRNGQSIAYGNGAYVQATSTLGQAVRSVNGTAWVNTALPGATETCRVVTFGNGKFIIRGRYESFASEDGITWTKCSFGLADSAAVMTTGLFIPETGKHVYSGPNNRVLLSTVVEP